MVSSLKVVHESETQRQHVRVKIPASARIGTKLYKVKDISAGGLSVYADEKLSNHSASLIKILFPFNAYSFNLEVNALVVDYDTDKKVANLKFVDLNPSQTSLLNYIIKSYMTGTLVTEGDLIGVVSRNNFVKPKAAAEAETDIRTALRRILPTLFIVLLGAAGLLFFLGNVYENSSVLKSYQGVVESTPVQVRSIAEGTVTMLIPPEADTVTVGQPLAVIEAPFNSSRMVRNDIPVGEAGKITLNSPCDCYIQTRHVNNGEFNAFGQPILTLVPVDSKLWVTALISPEKAHHLRFQGDANIRIAGEGGFVAGHITDISVDGLEKPYTRVTVRPEAKLPLEMLGRPAYVEFAGN